MNNYVLIEVKGKNTALFLNKIIKNNISYNNYKNISHDKIRLKIKYDDYLVIQNNKSIYEISIIKYYGLIKLKKLFNIYKHYLLAFVLSFIIIIILNNFIFEIEIVHNDKYIRNLIKSELKNNNVDLYHIAPNYDKRKKIKNKILINNKDRIEWLEIEKIGSKILVKVTERKVNKKEKVLHPRHIIAKKTGIIKKIESEAGVIIKKKEDYVEKGDIIISGDVIKDETVKGQVVAKGCVYAEVWYNLKIKYPLYYNERVYLSDVKNNLTLKIFDKNISLRKNYISISDKHVLYKSRLFPIELYISKSRKTKTTRQKLSTKKAIEKALELSSKKINNTLKKGEYIIYKKPLKFYSNSSTIEMDVFFKVYENITDYKDTEDKEIVEEKLKNDS